MDERAASAEERAALGPSASILRRRQVAAQVRRRRLLLADVALGLAVALLVLALGPGLAPVAIGALVVLGVCIGSFAYERLRQRRSRSAASTIPSATRYRVVSSERDEVSGEEPWT